MLIISEKHTEGTFTGALIKPMNGTCDLRRLDGKLTKIANPQALRWCLLEKQEAGIGVTGVAEEKTIDSGKIFVASIFAKICASSLSSSFEIGNGSAVTCVAIVRSCLDSLPVRLSSIHEFSLSVAKTRSSIGESGAEPLRT